MLSADILHLRTKLGLSSLQLAERLGVDHSLVLQWESEERFATRKHCERMATLLREYDKNSRDDTQKALGSSSSSGADSSVTSSPESSTDTFEGS